MAATGIAIILLGVFAGIIPFIGPLFDFGMGPEAAWVMTTSRFVRHVIPAAAIVIGGFMIMPRAGSSRRIGVTLAILGGTWLTIAPIVLGRGGEGVPPLIDIIRPLAYHFGTGVIIAILAGFAAGRLGRTEAAEATERAPRRERAAATRPTEA